MDDDQARQFGAYLRERRTNRGMSAFDLAVLVDIHDSTISRLEQGKIAQPAPDKLVRIADALDIVAADLLTLAGYSEMNELPTLPIYLRTKYDLPPEALEQVQRFATKIAHKHGIDLLTAPPGKRER